MLPVGARIDNTCVKNCIIYEFGERKKEYRKRPKKTKKQKNEKKKKKKTLIHNEREVYGKRLRREGERRERERENEL